MSGRFTARRAVAPEPVTVPDAPVLLPMGNAPIVLNAAPFWTVTLPELPFPLPIRELFPSVNDEPRPSTTTLAVPVIPMNELPTAEYVLPLRMFTFIVEFVPDAMSR